jgi:hypothetical protein
MTTKLSPTVSALLRLHHAPAGAAGAPELYQRFNTSQKVNRKVDRKLDRKVDCIMMDWVRFN